MRVVLGALLASITLLPGVARGQQDDRPIRGMVAVVAGEFIPENPSRVDAGAPVVGLRFGRPVNRVFLAEAGFSYALDDGARAPNDPLGVVAADLGLQARLPHGRYRPYIGASLGALRAPTAATDRRLVPAVAGAIGAWIGAAPNVTVIGEIRMRGALRGEAPGGTEQTIGVAWRI
jgi:hypothetical protein